MPGAEDADIGSISRGFPSSARMAHRHVSIRGASSSRGRDKGTWEDRRGEGYQIWRLDEVFPELILKGPRTRISLSRGNSIYKAKNEKLERTC